MAYNGGPAGERDAWLIRHASARRAVCEAFREVVDTHLTPGRYDPLAIFVLKE